MLSASILVLNDKAYIVEVLNRYTGEEKWRRREQFEESQKSLLGKLQVFNQGSGQ